MPRSAPLAAALAGLLALPLTPAPAHAASKHFRATLSVPGHHPKVGRIWPVVVTATYEGKGVRASLRYEFLFGGTVVSRQSHFRFKGRFRDDTFKWPASAVGFRLTLRAVVSSRYGTRKLDYWVEVRP